MGLKKEQVSIIAAAFAGGLIIGFGLWGGNKEKNNYANEAVMDSITANSEAVMNKVVESSRAVDALSQEIQFLRKAMELNVSSKLEADELNKKEVEALTREVRSLRQKVVLARKSTKPPERPSGRAPQVPGNKKGGGTGQSSAVKAEDTFSFLEFDYGSFTINEENTHKLDAIITTLHNKPDLNIEITGYIDIEGDTEALRSQRFNNKLKARKLYDMEKSGLKRIPLDEIIIEQNEYERYLKSAYKVETFPKPRNIIGFPKNLSASEMEELINSHINITDDNLRSLVSQRTREVGDYILASEKVNPERLFINNSPSLSPETKEGAGDNVVILKITPSSQR